MASFHSRSKSFPTTQSQPTMSNAEDRIGRLAASEATSPASIDSACSKLSKLTNLQEDINSLIQMHSNQQSLAQNRRSISELLDESLSLVDLCGFARDVVLCLKKESLQELQSCVRRNRREYATLDEINAYLASQKNINKRVKKFFENFIKESKLILDKDNDHGDITSVIKESNALELMTLKSVVEMICEEKHRSKKRNWTLLSKFVKVNNRVRSEEEFDQSFSLKQLRELESSIKELEEGLEALFRSLVKTRVSLLNVLAH